MKKRFIVCIDNSTKEQDKIFIDFLRENNLGWWHWLSHTWLIVNTAGNLDAAFLRTKLRDIFQGEHNIVIEISETNDTWAGFGPKSEVKNMFKWLKDNWKKD